MLLGPNKTQWSVEKFFPNASKMAILFSGGVESTLIASIAIDLYGANNVFLLWSDSMFCNDNSTIKQAIKFNVESVATSLGLEPIYAYVDYEYYKINPLIAQRDAWMNAQSNLGFDHMAMGLTAMFWDIGPLQNLSKQEIIDYCYSDPVKHKAMIEQFHMDTDLYTEYLKMNIDPNVLLWLKENVGKQFHFPLGTLHKEEVIDLYYQLGKQDLLYKTMSCLSGTGIHCGKCFDCQNRYDAHDIAGIEDKTIYGSNLIKEQRARLK